MSTMVPSQRFEIWFGINKDNGISMTDEKPQWHDLKLRASDLSDQSDLTPGKQGCHTAMTKYATTPSNGTRFTLPALRSECGHRSAADLPSPEPPAYSLYYSSHCVAYSRYFVQFFNCLRILFRATEIRTVIVYTW